MPGEETCPNCGHTFSCRSTHGMWRGDDVSINGLHKWLNYNHPRTGTCGECGEAKSTDWALKKGLDYSRDINDYRELCRRCHTEYDRV